jgi:hypothetical protein
MGWCAGALSGDPDYEIHDELWTHDGRRVAVLECFTYNPDIFYCNAITPAGRRQFGAGHSLDIAKDWAERVVGLKPDRPLMPGYGIAK